MYVELFRLTRSIWHGVSMHVVEDSLLNPLVIDSYITMVSGREIWLSPIAGIVTSLLYLIVGLILRYIRIRRAKPAL